MPKISEIFFGYQGEGSRTGCPSVFVRFAGCNFFHDKPSHPCKWCDTSYAWKTNPDWKSDVKDYLFQDLIDEVKHWCRIYHTKEIVLTGGEPLYSNEAFDFIETLCQNYLITVQTNGSLPIWKSKALWAMDCKCPSSGNESHNLYTNFNLLTHKDQIKFVIANKNDYDFAKSQLKNVKKSVTVLFQPAWMDLKPDLLIECLKADKLGRVRLSLQMQKYVYGAGRRGV
jgi:7-carboxy-7-deazaguanine synthase